MVAQRPLEALALVATRSLGRAELTLERTPPTSGAAWLSELPVTLPEEVAWKPTGESPLKLHPSWAEVSCPICAQPSRRDTDTMVTFICSSWYHLRYLSPDYTEGPFNPNERSCTSSHSIPTPAASPS